jgi:hypothetical protein
MTEWNYGGAYKHYDLTGIIELPHDSRVMVCDWTRDIPVFMLEADTLFIDPPWNLGNAKTFYTKAGQAYCGMSFVDFSQVLFQRIDYIGPQCLFLEIGKEYLSWYLEACKIRYRYVTFYNAIYYKRRQNKCYIIHATNIYGQRYHKELEDRDEAEIIAWICQHHNYQCIGDLCMGTGLVGKNAFLVGRRFVGTELNPKRLAVLVDFIRRHSQEIVHASAYL